jgi:hypothetical protein
MGGSACGGETCGLSNGLVMLCNVLMGIAGGGLMTGRVLVTAGVGITGIAYI